MAQDLSDNLNQILKETSRAFYLSLAILPPAARRSLSLAYLLARAADTVADSEAEEGTDRAKTLRQLQECLREPGLAESVELHPYRPRHAGEQRLLEQWPALLAELQSSSPLQSSEISDVVHTLIDGMLWDQELFEDSPVAGLSATELEKYTFLVAGCVGPFWSQSCAEGDPELQVLLSDEHREMAVEFGKALQWVNILRDIPKDQEQGRYYLSPMGSVEFGQQFFAGSHRALRAFRMAILYPHLFPSGYLRHRLAVILPLVLGLRTLEKLFQTGPRQGVRTKVSRKEVFFWLGLGTLCAPVSPLLTWILRYLHTRAESALKTLESTYE